MESIFHEKQEGSLCAQHCLNALLQGPYFTAVDLAALASELDDLERNELGSHSSSHVSQNMNEEGYFSIQVISKALSIWNLELVPLLQQSSEAQAARNHPEDQIAFICNFGNHWFTIRRFGVQWFDLNSLLSKPKLISATYLTMYLTQLQQEGQSIFFIVGSLPDCEAQQLISLCPVTDNHIPTVATNLSPSCTASAFQTDFIDEETKVALEISQAELDQENASLQRMLEKSRLEAQENELKEALRLSAEVDVKYLDSHNRSGDDEDLAAAIALSLNDPGPSFRPQTDPQTLQEELRRKHNAFLDKLVNK